MPAGPHPRPARAQRLPADPHRLPPPGEWFAPDAERHLLDRPRFCPMCGASLDDGLVSESWAADQRIFFTWCAACSWLGDVVRYEQVSIDEPAHVAARPAAPRPPAARPPAARPPAARPPAADH